MRMFSSIINRLHSVFNKSPEMVGVISIACPIDGYVAATETGLTTWTAQGEETIAFGNTTTLTEVVASLNTISGISATLTRSEYGGRIAKGIYEDTVQNGGSLAYPTSILWCEIMAYAFLLQQQAERIVAIAKELYGHTCDGIWSDLWWKSYFGIKRNQSEGDAAYYSRAKYELLSLKINNKALAKLIQNASGIKVDVVDLGYPKYFMTNTVSSWTNNRSKVLYDNTKGIIRDNAFGVYIYGVNVNTLSSSIKATIKNTCNKYRAAGTAAFYYAPVSFLNTNIDNETTNNKGYVLGPDTGQWVQVAF